MPRATNVSTAKPVTTGAIFRAALGSTLPTDASSALDEAFKELGFASEDGVSNNNTSDSEDVYAWGGTPVTNILSSKSDEWTLTLLEALNPDVLRTVYGDGNVTVSGSMITVKAGAGQIEDASYVIDMMLKGGALKRVVIPNGSLGEVGEIVYKDDEPIGYEITIRAMDDGTGTTHYEYINLAEAIGV